MYYLTGEDYATAKANGIPRAIVYNRYYRCNYDLKRALTEPVGAYKRVTPNMKEWEKWKDIAESNGINKHTFYNRLNAKVKKWTPKEAATHPVNLRRNTRIHPKIYSLAEENGINILTLRNRVFNLHWTPYRAATEDIHREGVLV
jgi:hypothetical protein